MRGKRCQLCAAIISPKTRGRPRNSVQAAARVPEPPRPELGGQLIRSKCSSTTGHADSRPRNGTSGWPGEALPTTPTSGRPHPRREATSNPTRLGPYPGFR